MSIDTDVQHLQSVLTDVVTTEQTANAALATSIAAAERYYDARVATLDVADTPARMNADRIAHTCAVADLAAALHTTATVIEYRFSHWWGSRPRYREMFTAGEISLETLRVIHDHTLGAPAATLAALERDIASAARILTPIRLGHEIDRLLGEIDPDWHSRARARAKATKRKVRVTPLPRGLARMSATIGAVDAAEAAALIDAELNLTCALDPRSIDTRRSEAFMAILRGGHLSCLCGLPDCIRTCKATEDDEDDEDSAEQDTTENTAAAAKSEEPGSDSGGSEGEASKGEVSEGEASKGEVSESEASKGEVSESDREDSDPIPAAIRHPHGATTTPATPLVVLSADLETLLGLHNRSAYLHGYGPIDPDTLRTLAADATWQIIFTLSRKYLDALTDYDDCTNHQHGDPPPTTTREGT